jgi:large conductance mechanosensitive channel
MFKEFKEFISRGSAIDHAIGVIIGAAFGGIVSSLVNDIIMPLISLVTGRIDFTNLFISLDGKYYPTLDAAKEAGVATLNYGAFIAIVINFLIIAFSIFIVIRQFNRFMRKKPAPQPTTKTCPYCMSSININAVRCPNCTSTLEG